MSEIAIYQQLRMSIQCVVKHIGESDSSHSSHGPPPFGASFGREHRQKHHGEYYHPTKGTYHIQGREDGLNESLGS